MSVTLEDTLQLASDFQNVAEVEQLIDKQAAELELDDELYGKLLLAVVEAVSNAMLHGNKLDPTKIVTLKYSITPTELVYTITDSGPGFNPTRIPDPTAESNVENDSGRGLFLMKALADEVKFFDGGSTVSILFKR